MTDISQLRQVDATTVEEINVLIAQLSHSTPPLSLENIRSVVENPNVELWVVRDGDRIVGMGALVCVLLLTNKYAHIDEVIVDEGQRGKGLGRLIMDKLIERAREHNATGIELTSRPSRIAANELYKKLGFELRDTNVYRLKF